jgi:hypothetical protein
MKDTAPVVEGNECHTNEMAGIGCRDGAIPVLRNNVCRNNRMAGIGCDGGAPLIVGNDCRDNRQAGIGVQGRAKVAIHANKCFDNKLVAIGVTGGSTAVIIDNDLGRTGGIPPIIAVRDDSTAMIRDNRISGGGVAALLLQGQAVVSQNEFTGIQEKQGNAVWIWEGSKASVSENSFDGYRTAVNATKARVVISENKIRRFRGPAIIVKHSPFPVHIFDNTGISADPESEMVVVEETSGIVKGNTLTKD